MKSNYSTIGVMAGSSMDGLDIAQVVFCNDGSHWSFSLEQSRTIPYSDELLQMLASSPEMPKKEQEYVDFKFGEWIAAEVNRFIDSNKLSISSLSVHGHTVIHDPKKKISWQLGSGRVIAEKTGINTVTDFRSADVLLGGQGAPLVPLGDFILFNEYDACLNLGGIANVSLRSSKTAWDITPCNQVLNFYANQLGKEYDEDGIESRNGALDRAFIMEVQSNSFFNEAPPKSLANKYLSSKILNSVSPKNGLRSMTEFIAEQIASDLASVNTASPKILITGGGAHNSFLIDRIKFHLSKWEVIIPSKSIIDFKEAIVFAFLGVLKMRSEINTLASVTGASKDSSSGMIHFAK
jgi:anhydro-N-acetylmuramic acid kinase